MKHNRVLLYSLLALSALFLATTVYIVGTYGQTVYFVAFHRPFHIGGSSSSASSEPVIDVPSFRVVSAVTQPSLAAGGTQTVTVQTSINRQVEGFLEVWITSPANRQVYRSPMDVKEPQTFVANHPQSFTFSYTIPAGAPIGTYHVSDLITSPDTETDYYVNEDFASFTVR